MITTVTIRSALGKIAEAACGMTPALIRVVVPSSQEPRVFIAAVPFEFCGPVYQYLAEHLSVRIPLEGDPLVLTVDEALQILNLANNLPLVSAAA
jgi:hypothetical protein